KRNADAGVEAREQAESRAGVAHVGELEDAGDDVDRLARVKTLGDDVLRQLVEGDDRARDREQDEVLELHQLFQHQECPSTARTQRLQSCGCAAVWPTSTVYTQQRAHFSPLARATTI